MSGIKKKYDLYYITNKFGTNRLAAQTVGPLSLATVVGIRHDGNKREQLLREQLHVYVVIFSNLFGIGCIQKYIINYSIK